MRRKDSTYLQKVDLIRTNQDIIIAIKARLDERKMSVNKLATELGISRESLGSFLNQKSHKSISQWTLMKLCEYLGIKVEIKVSFV